MFRTQFLILFKWHLSQASLFSHFLLDFLAWWFNLSVMGSVPSKMCSGRLVNCASKAPMRGNGEIAHAGTQKLGGPVAQLVIIVHLTAVFQLYHRDVVYYSQCDSANVNRRNNLLYNSLFWNALNIKDMGIVMAISRVRERAGQEGKEPHFVDDVVSWKAFFFPAEAPSLGPVKQWTGLFGGRASIHTWQYEAEHHKWD